MDGKGRLNSVNIFYCLIHPQARIYNLMKLYNELQVLLMTLTVFACYYFHNDYIQPCCIKEFDQSLFEFDYLFPLILLAFDLYSYTYYLQMYQNGAKIIFTVPNRNSVKIIRKVLYEYHNFREEYY